MARYSGLHDVMTDYNRMSVLFSWLGVLSIDISICLHTVSRDNVDLKREIQENCGV